MPILARSQDGASREQHACSVAIGARLEQNLRLQTAWLWRILLKCLSVNLTEKSMLNIMLLTVKQKLKITTKK